MAHFRAIAQRYSLKPMHTFQRSEKPWPALCASNGAFAFQNGMSSSMMPAVGLDLAAGVRSGTAPSPARGRKNHWAPPRCRPRRRGHGYQQGQFAAKAGQHHFRRLALIAVAIVNSRVCNWPSR